MLYRKYTENEKNQHQIDSARVEGNKNEEAKFFGDNSVKFEVDIWSSKTLQTVQFAMNNLLYGKKYKFLFCWNLVHCTMSTSYRPENTQEETVFKDCQIL